MFSYLKTNILLFSGNMLDYTLAPYLNYPLTAYFLGGACCGISVLGAGGQGFFLPRHIDSGLVLGLTVISMSFFVSDSFRLCAVLA